MEKILRIELHGTHTVLVFANWNTRAGFLQQFLPHEKWESMEYGVQKENGKTLYTLIWRANRFTFPIHLGEVN